MHKVGVQEQKYWVEYKLMIIGCVSAQKTVIFSAVRTYRNYIGAGRCQNTSNSMKLLWLKKQNDKAAYH